MSSAEHERLLRRAMRDAHKVGVATFVMRKPDSQLVFDIDLAKQQSLDNPVYYVQYAHARICSIFENAVERGFSPPEPQTVALGRLETAIQRLEGTVQPHESDDSSL